MKLSNRQIGAVGVQRVAGALLRLGYQVLTPMEDYCGYDLVAHKGRKFTRIQVKTSEKKDPRGNRYGFMTSKGMDSKSRYKSVDVDMLVCWGMEDDLFWMLKPRECKAKSYKAPIRHGSSWRILSDL